MLTPVHHPKCRQWDSEHRNWTLEQWKKVVWTNESYFLLQMWTAVFTDTIRYRDALWEEDNPVAGV